MKEETFIEKLEQLRDPVFEYSPEEISEKKKKYNIDTDCPKCIDYYVGRQEKTPEYYMQEHENGDKSIWDIPAVWEIIEKNGIKPNKCNEKEAWKLLEGHDVVVEHLDHIEMWWNTPLVIKNSRHGKTHKNSDGSPVWNKFLIDGTHTIAKGLRDGQLLFVVEIEITLAFNALIPHQ
jgi:hypothetical protein